ncbi:MAG TPA: IclR family transcriptional regulator [Trebonia sp.]|jgi:DNA-binding IclR family transcriptional regulator|nr:IclR family transcriptional regulator [Trebonia sp.]
MAGATNPSGTQAVDRAARLLAEVVHSAVPVTFTELTAVTGLAKSTTSRLLLALERGGLVRRDDLGRFLPGEMFVSFAWRGGADTSLVAVAQPFMDQLGKSTGETINLGIASGPPGDTQAETIAQVDCTYLIGGTNWVGLSVPLHASALGKVLLAHGAAQVPARPRPGQSRHEELPRVTDKTITSLAGLRAELAGVRSRGYAVSDEELEAGLIAIAAPVFRYDGTVVAALSVSAPTSRMRRDTATAVARRCVEEAAGLSSALGYRPRARKGA